MSRIPRDRILVSLTLDMEAGYEKVATARDYIYEKLDELMKEAPGFKGFRVLSAGDDPMDYLL